VCAAIFLLGIFIWFVLQLLCLVLEERKKEKKSV